MEGAFNLVNEIDRPRDTLTTSIESVRGEQKRRTRSVKIRENPTPAIVSSGVTVTGTEV